MTTQVPRAHVRAEVALPLALDDGSTTVARMVSFHGLVDGREHVALGLGPAGSHPPLVRLHSECLTGDAFGSRRCDCGPQLAESLLRITAEGGWLLYLRQEGRGIGLYNKLDAYVLQDLGLDTYDANTALGHGADERDYTVAVQMLDALGVRSLALLGNNPDKADQLVAAGVEVVRRVPTGVHLTEDNARYLAAKAGRGAHALALPVLET
ncbi:GTP cyclohydrolase II [Phycicoccus sp. HDW14]|uniref:GTP cyclohydrolase II n=1 Tax=Phycicoccus sp. HDW14 TaxID=2714941 RepID=UPI00140A7229|nr:GTP cyclohydrolase II [Phycicoccus sp. HDW14]QIM22120.1 GTP cyclohydrolase II [Phycicoccus sp. HDW14]